MVMLDRFVKYVQVILIRIYICTYLANILLIHLLSNKGPVLNGKEKKVMNTLAAIYGLWILEKHLGHLYEFGILVSKNQVTKIHETLLDLCKNLVPNAIALVEVLAPPDFIVNSILGNSDGDIYKHLQQSFYENSFGRASYWKDITKFMSKL